MDAVAPVSAAKATAEAAARKNAGQQFEALMIERMLAAARPAATGPQADYRAMADKQVAAELARQAPLGIARLLNEGKSE